MDNLSESVLLGKIPLLGTGYRAERKLKYIYLIYYMHYFIIKLYIVNF